MSEHAHTVSALVAVAVNVAAVPILLAMAVVADQTIWRILLAVAACGAALAAASKAYRLQGSLADQAPEDERS